MTFNIFALLLKQFVRDFVLHFQVLTPKKKLYTYKLNVILYNKKKTQNSKIVSFLN